MNAPDKGQGAPSIIIPATLSSRENGKGCITAPIPFFSNVLFFQGRVETSPISDDEPTVLGEEPPSVMRDDDGIGAITYGITTKLETTIRLSLSLGTKFLRWGKPSTKEHTENTTTLAAMIAATFKNVSEGRPSRMSGSNMKTRSSLGTYTLTSLEH
jgi:hypothetical protein